MPASTRSEPVFAMDGWKRGFIVSIARCDLHAFVINHNIEIRHIYPRRAVQGTGLSPSSSVFHSTQVSSPCGSLLDHKPTGISPLKYWGIHFQVSIFYIKLQINPGYEIGVIWSYKKQFDWLITVRKAKR